jgi:hypothetical protein
MQRLTPPFPMSGAGVLAIEAAAAALLIGAFWVAYPEGFAKLGGVLAVILLGCLGLAYAISAKVRSAPEREGRARIFLVLGAVLGFIGLFLGLVGGPHLAGVIVYGIGAQLLTLILGRIALAI